MTTDHDSNWHALQSAGDVPPASPEALARARQRLPEGRRRVTGRRLIPVVAAAAVVAAAVAVAVQQYGPEGPVLVGPAPTTSTTPRSTMSPSPPLPTNTGSANSCVSGPTKAWLRKMQFAFDGTVIAIEEKPRSNPRYLVTFQVHEWFRRPAGLRKATILADAAPQGRVQQADSDPRYLLGKRYLVTGMEQFKNSNRWVAWTCEFSRAYNEKDAATWRQLFK